MTPILQPGVQLDLAWRARMDDHIGSYTVEPLQFRTALLSDRLALLGLGSICALLSFALPDRAPHPTLYDQSVALLDLMLSGGDWGPEYLQWELCLLEEAGFGLDLRSCAVTGATTDLAFVSPRSGRAVSRAGAGDWADRLLPMPPMLVGGPATPEGLGEGLRLTGHFLERALAAALGNRPLPDARRRLVTLFARQAGS
jgi:DNA repair protein RecO (recombination protein O)